MVCGCNVSLLTSTMNQVANESSCVLFFQRLVKCKVTFKAASEFRPRDDAEAPAQVLLQPPYEVGLFILLPSNRFPLNLTWGDIFLERETITTGPFGEVLGEMCHPAPGLPCTLSCQDRPWALLNLSWNKQAKK